MTSTRLKHPKSSSLAAFVLLLAGLAPCSSFADLMINPTRVVFEGNQRSAQVDVINDGTTPATYRVRVVNRQMTETGEFKDITSPGAGDQFADAMLVYSPRQIVLKPGTQQLVRIALRKPADLADGEYRSHLLFEKVADPGLSNTLESQVKPGPNEVGVSIAALVGVSIPVIVRQGKTDATTTISGIALAQPRAPGQPGAVEFELNRSGNRSVYGDLSATFKKPAGQEQLVAQAGGVAVYVPNSHRKVRLNLQLAPGMQLAGGTLTVSYKERIADSGKLLAENSIQIP
jgi:fimbrial chaperone protein